MKRIVFAGAAAVLGAALFASPALADGYVILQCDESTCYIFECSSYPTGDPWTTPGCSYVHSYPRPREVGGD